ncbi:HD domain-containing protein [Thiosocius teredinicola]|uniref:HD domain-containing protein n=1 Tax=Thiosocius teredinicola TaxID=1973002 RepID=UPI0013DD89E0
MSAVDTAHAYAQTNLQLYTQLRTLGYSEASLGDTRRAYDLAIVLFSGRYRSNGKPFLAHLVGTASILAAHGAAPDVVVAGLLHACYMQGQFGDADIGVTSKRTELVRAYASASVDRLVQAYSRMPWNSETIDAMHSDPDALRSQDADIVLMRLANDLEDHLDLGMLFGRKASQAMPATVAIAKQLGCPDLADALTKAYAAERDAEIPEALRIDRKSSYTIRPRTRSRLNALRVLMKKVRRRLGS